MSNIDKQTREELRKRYTPPEIPKCKICGSELSIQRCGGGEPTVYACDGYEADPENPGMVRRAAGRDIADKHYEESRYIDWKKGGDSDVVALLDELEAAEKRIAELEARQVLLPPKAPDNLASCLDGYEKWLIATTFRDTWNACLAEVVRVNAAAGKGE